VTAPLAVELSVWARQELARDGGSEMLDALWDSDGLPSIIVEKLIERSGVTEPYIRATDERRAER